MYLSTYLYLFAITLGLVNASHYKKYKDEEHVYTGCSTAVNAAALFCPKKKKASAKYLVINANSSIESQTQSKKKKVVLNSCLCSTDIGLASFVNCNYMHSGEFNELSDKLIIKGCKKLNVTLKAADLHDAYSKFPKDSYVEIYKNKSFNGSTDVINKPILVSPKKYTAIYLSNKIRYDNVTYGFNYGIALVAYFAGVFAIAAFFNWTKYLFPGAYNIFNNKMVHFWRKYITLSPTFRSKHIQPITFLKVPFGLIPTRLESVVLLGYFILHVVFLTVHYTHVEGNTVFATKQNEISRYIGDRTALLLSFTTPITILFAGKNNFLIWFTGIKQESFMVYHRWCARILTVVLIIHVGGFVSQSYAVGNIYTRLKADYFRWGIVGFSMALALCVHAIYFVRSRFYETFLLFHLLFGFFFIFSSWRHAASQGYAQWYYAAAACWIFDRVVSGFRVLSFGFPKATIQLVANEILKVTVKKPSYWKSFPGAYAYVYFFTGTSFWQSHPFTILDSAVHENEITFQIKVKNGVTASIAEELRHLANNKMVMRISVEGPYGVSIPVKKYERAVLFASGSGIPGLYYYAASLAKNTSKANKTIKLIWVVRYYESIEWMYEELLKLKNTNVETIIHVTRPHASKEQILTEHTHYSEKEESNDEAASVNKEDSDEKAPVTEEVEKTLFSVDLKSMLNELSFIKFVESRPSIKELVSTEIELAEKSVAFVSCGHASMVDKLRLEVADQLSNRVRVDYFEENQQW